MLTFHTPTVVSCVQPLESSQNCFIMKSILTQQWTVEHFMQVKPKGNLFTYYFRMHTWR